MFGYRSGRRTTTAPPNRPGLVSLDFDSSMAGSYNPILPNWEGQYAVFVCEFEGRRPEWKKLRANRSWRGSGSPGAFVLIDRAGT